MRRGGTREAFLLASVIVLPLACALVVALPVDRDAHDFQDLVGGLGLGPAVDFSRCAAEFDPRVACTCSLGHDPVPGGALFCPPHAGAGR